MGLLQPFYCPLSWTTRVNRFQKNHSRTHLSWSSSNLYQLFPSTMIHSILPSLFNLRAWQCFCTTSFQVLHLILIHSLPNQCRLFATHDHTIAACFAVVPRLCHLFLVSLSTVLGTLSFTLTSHIHLSILIIIVALWEILNETRHGTRLYGTLVD